MKKLLIITALVGAIGLTGFTAASAFMGNYSGPGYGYGYCGNYGYGARGISNENGRGHGFGHYRGSMMGYTGWGSGRHMMDW